jgi:hypothetical protein
MTVCATLFSRRFLIEQTRETRRKTNESSDAHDSNDVVHVVGSSAARPPLTEHCFEKLRTSQSLPPTGYGAAPQHRAEIPRAERVAAGDEHAQQQYGSGQTPQLWLPFFAAAAMAVAAATSWCCSSC